MVNNEGNELHIPKKRRPQLKALSIPGKSAPIRITSIGELSSIIDAYIKTLDIPKAHVGEPIYMKTVDIPKTGYTYAIPPTAPLSPESGLPLDEEMEHGRVAYAMDPGLAGPLLQRFMEKYPMTGRRKVAAPLATAKGKHAAVVQQRIEFLLMQQKEKKALEALQAQIKEMDEATDDWA